MTAAQYAALACTSPWWASGTAFAIYGLWTLTRRAARTFRRAAVWLRQPRAAAQPDLDQHAEQACALTRAEPTPPAIGRAAVPAFTEHQWDELVNAFAADAYTYRSGGGMPGETRTTWTREDYRS